MLNVKEIVFFFCNKIKVLHLFRALDVLIGHWAWGYEKCKVTINTMFLSVYQSCNIRVYFFICLIRRSISFLINVRFYSVLLFFYYVVWRLIYDLHMCLVFHYFCMDRNICGSGSGWGFCRSVVWFCFFFLFLFVTLLYTDCSKLFEDLFSYISNIRI